MARVGLAESPHNQPYKCELNLSSVGCPMNCFNTYLLTDLPITVHLTIRSSSTATAWRLHPAFLPRVAKGSRRKVYPDIPAFRRTSHSKKLRPAISRNRLVLVGPSWIKWSRWTQADRTLLFRGNCKSRRPIELVWSKVKLHLKLKLQNCAYEKSQKRQSMTERLTCSRERTVPLWSPNQTS